MASKILSLKSTREHIHNQAYSSTTKSVLLKEDALLLLTCCERARDHVRLLGPSAGLECPTVSESGPENARGAPGHCQPAADHHQLRALEKRE